MNVKGNNTNFTRTALKAVSQYMWGESTMEVQISGIYYSEPHLNLEYLI